MKGYIINVYKYKRNGTDCTNGGVSARHDTLLLVGEGVPEIFDDRGDLPLVMIKSRGNYKYLVPVGPSVGVVGPMFGGNFGYHSDSRITALFDGHPLAIHDRFETEEQHRILSV